jgi:hypothetical protein
MKSPIRLLVGGAAGLAAAAVPVLLLANAATAAPATFKAVTHLSNRADTCANSTLPNNVWAYDNMSRQFTVTQTGTDTYTVNITDNGSFAAMADPVSGAPLNVHGSLTGTQTYTVTADRGPDASALPSQIGDGTSTSDMITQDLFHGANATMGDGAYSYTYQAGGHVYIQNTVGATGDIAGS